MAASSDASTPGLVTRLQTWAAHPFTNDMDLLQVTLTVGLIVVLVWFWTRILGVGIGDE